MKIINLPLILLALTLVSCSSNVIKDYEENLLFINNINGCVESILSETFEAEDKFGEIQKGDPATPNFYLPINSIISGNSFYEFTKQGKLKTIKNESKYYSYRSTFDYDDSGNIVEQNYEYDDTKPVYREDGKVLKGPHITKFKIEKDKIVSSITYDEEGEKYRTSDIVFEGDLIKEIVSKDEKGTLINKIKYSYENGIQTQSLYNKEGKLTQQYKRDIDGRTLESYLSYSDKKTQFIYKEGIVFPVEIKIYEDNDISGKMYLSFDEKHNITEIKEIDEDGEIDTKYSFTYKFDDNGNWIEQATYEDEELEYITTRNIEYYKN